MMRRSTIWIRHWKEQSTTGLRTWSNQPTHLMHGAEYDEPTEAVENYKDKFESVKLQNHFSVKSERMKQRSMRIKQLLQKQLQQKL